MGPTDEDLVAAVQAGDVSAFDVLVRRWDRKIQGAAFRVLGSPDEARDVSQEAFMKAFRALRGFKQESRFSSWLYQIAMNVCRDKLRRRRGREHLSLDDGRRGTSSPRFINGRLRTRRCIRGTWPAPWQPRSKRCPRSSGKSSC